MRRAAFTLLELLLVLAIISSLVGIGIPTFRRQHARAEFKNGVVQLQIDLHRTRLLAMQTGTPYMFRYVPGSGIYEIAPVRSLQEAIYRENGDFGDAANGADSALGGELGATGVALGDSTGALGASVYAGDDSVARETSATGPRYSDDLFSAENVAADLAAARGTSKGVLGATGGSAFGSVGGGLASTPTAQTFGTFGTTAGTSDAFGDAATGFGGPFVGSAEDASFAGGAVSGVGNVLTGVVASRNPNSLRDLNADEKGLAAENVLAWRVNSDGALFRKNLGGNAIFTFGRVSKSTPLNLKTERPDGLKASTSASGSTDGEFASELTGSLSRVPGSDSGGLGGGDSEGLTGGLSLSSAFGDFATGLDGGEAKSVAPSLWAEPLVFYPNGRTSTAVVGLACVGEFRYYSEIALRGMTGVARISSISALPPGADEASALPREEYFRLTRPGFPASGGVDGLDANGNPTSATATALGGLGGGSLGDVSTGIDVAPEIAEPSTEFGSGFDANVGTGLNPNAGTGVETGSTPDAASGLGAGFGSGFDANVGTGLNPNAGTGVETGSTPDAASGLGAGFGSGFDAASGGLGFGANSANDGESINGANSANDDESADGAKSEKDDETGDGGESEENGRRR